MPCLPLNFNLDNAYDVIKTKIVCKKAVKKAMMKVFNHQLKNGVAELVKRFA